MPAGFAATIGEGDASRQQRLERLGQRLASRLLRRYRRQPPELWFTYHLYHKAPDWLGPVVSRALSIPYVVAEASLARKQAAGSWAAGYAASLAAIAQADLVLAMTQHDAPGLADVVSPERLRLFPPFLDAAPLVAASRVAFAPESDAAPRLLAVAMMRRDVKLLSYRLLADALRLLDDLPWRLDLVGDGEAREEVAALFAPFGDRVRLVGCPIADGAA